MQHTLNEGVAGREIDVLLLDERFHRDTKPCHTRRDFCNFTNPKKTKYMWYLSQPLLSVILWDTGFVDVDISLYYNRSFCIQSEASLFG
jgi:hypothetical protein